VIGREFDDDGNLVYDPDDPLAPVKKAVKECADPDLIPGRVAAAVEAMARFGMDTQTRITVRAYLKREKALGVGATTFDDIVEAARRARRRSLPHTSPHPKGAADDAHPHTPPTWASDQDILKRMVRTLRVCMGLVGENRNAKLTYLAVTSRLLGKQVSIVVKGLSSSGKSFTVECVLVLFPEEAVYTMTAMSERALIYLDEELAHRTVVLFEATALREGREKAEDNQTAYIVRSLLSEGRIEYPTVIRDEDGTLRTVKLTKEGPTNLVTTTTSISLHGENETRMFSLPSNDTKAQTRAVLVSSSGDDDGDREHDFSDWHAYQRWLSAANHQVTIPFARCIAAQIPPVAVRLRRDWNGVRALIRAHALMHQLNRDTDSRGRIVATLNDYKAVRSLVADLVAEAAGTTVPATVRETVDLVRALTLDIEGHPPPDPDGVRVGKVADMLKLERSAATRRLHSARDRGYLVNLEDKRGKPARYVLGDRLPEQVILLPKPDDVCTAECTHLGDGEIPDQDCDCIGVCRCADDADPTEAGNIQEAGQEASR
jgi:hypothetical protein